MVHSAPAGIRGGCPVGLRVGAAIPLTAGGAGQLGVDEGLAETNPAATAFWRKAIRHPFREYEQGTEIV
jgi:hypothetical protein